MPDYAVPLVVGLLSTGGLLGGIVLLLKLRPEAGQIVVTAAQGAVVVQAGVLRDLEIENTRLSNKATGLENKVASLETENNKLKGENLELRGRVTSLELRVDQLSRQVNGN